MCVFVSILYQGPPWSWPRPKHLFLTQVFDRIALVRVGQAAEQGESTPKC
jgi:hypothetical protein